MTDYAIRCSRCGWLASGPAPALPFLARRAHQHFMTCAPHSAQQPSRTQPALDVTHATRPSPATATCPGSLIVTADGTTVGCTEDTEREGCRGLDCRHAGAAIHCFVSSLEG
jgi:hypothetical protein